MALKTWVSCVVGLALLQSIHTQASVIRDSSSNGGTLSLRAVRTKVDTAQGSEIGSTNLDKSWNIGLTIGTPPQSFVFLGDTGSSNMAIASVFLPTNESEGKPKYDPSKSSTSKRLDGYTYESDFVSGDHSEGYVYQDTVTIGGVTIRDMDFGVQTSNNHDDEKPGNRSGTLGLSHNQMGQSSKPQKVPTWLQRVMPNLKAELFTVDYNAQTDSGLYNFGFIDTTKYKGSIGYSKVDTSTVGGGPGWTIKIDGLQLPNSDKLSASWYITVDTGTQGSKIPPSIAKQYFDAVPGAKFVASRETYTFPCDAKLPDFVFALGDFRGTIPSANLKEDGGSGDACTSIIKVGSEDAKMNIWGQTFIERFFVVFDWANDQVGFGNK